ncbi:Gfo/Idh/MocA family protein [Bosea sp. (in: a-proteobacteria)]|jgi:predicted dehydrogenase|uniref:Gfo/Idh/MocA family protein n=1 Tax=Bosea sp. (in: a-proteobacteria) TaxID=1871050 RepID=UPI003F703939
MIRVAVVGLGWWGRHIVRRMAGTDRLAITVAVETNLEPHREFAAEYGLKLVGSLDGALADPAIDAVILCTPHSMHTAQVLAVAAAGKHCFCEKPLALTRADAERSVAAAKAANVVLGLGHERRFEPAMRRLRELVGSGALGRFVHVEANFSHDKLAKVAAGDWRASPVDAPAAGMTAMGIHLSDAFLDLFGPITEVYARVARPVSERANGDVVSVVASFADGGTGYLNAILVTPLFIGMRVFCSDAWVEIRNHTHPDTPGPTTLIVQHRDGRRETEEFDWEDAVRHNLEAFVETIEAGAAYPFTDAHKIGNIAVLEAIGRSVAENRPVKVDPVA